jgi:hypothetical protein
VTLFQRMSMSGWWPAASAAPSTSLMNVIAAAKSRTRRSRGVAAAGDLVEVAWSWSGWFVLGDPPCAFRDIERAELGDR